MIVSNAAGDLPRLFQQAVQSYQSGRFDEAEARCKAVLRVDPGFFDALHLLAVVQLGLGRAQEALANCDRAIALRPGHPGLHDNRGIALQELGRFAEALASHDRALAIKPDFAAAMGHRAAALHGLKRFEDALTSYDRALAIEPRNVDALHNRGNTLQELQRFEEALTSYDRALALQPNYAEALNSRGSCLQALRRFEEALASYGRAVAIRPDYAEAQNNAGVVFMELGRFDEAIARFRQALVLRPDFTEARIQLAMAVGRSHATAGNTAGAADSFRQALALDADDRCGAALHLARLGAIDAADAMSPAYVRTLFDNYAPNFDASLKSLSYVGPTRLRGAVEKARPGVVFDRMLDLGCGTGLAGVEFRPLVRHLAGVDLSSGMVEQARAKAVYDRLVVGDLVEFAQAERQRGGAYDLVLAADVFVYLFDLAPIAAAIAAVMTPGGLFAFTVETHDGDGIEIGAGLRYRHGAAHVRQAMTVAGLERLELAPVVNRTEGHKDVPALLVVATRPEATTTGT